MNLVEYGGRLGPRGGFSQFEFYPVMVLNFEQTPRNSPVNVNAATAPRREWMLRESLCGRAVPTLVSEERRHAHVSVQK
jgi:hypothetical protein